MPSFEALYERQILFQSIVLSKMCSESCGVILPKDDVEWFKYHCLAMMEEMGEVMQSDKRWKTHRNEKVDVSEKLDEFSDVFITFMNMAMFSGFTSEQILQSVESKIQKNIKRIGE